MRAVIQQVQNNLIHDRRSTLQKHLKKQTLQDQVWKVLFEAVREANRVQKVKR